MSRVKQCQCCGGPLDFMLDRVLQLLCYRCYHARVRDDAARIEFAALEEVTLP